MAAHKKNNNTKATAIRIVCIVLAAAIIFSVIASAIWY